MLHSFHHGDRAIPPPNLFATYAGSDGIELTLIEYGDYECLNCAHCHFIIKVMQQQLGQRFQFIFRHFPQTDRHPHAQHAAEAAEAARSQSKFWQMHEYLSEHQHALTDADLVEYAIWSNLNLSQFLRDMSHHTYAQRISESFEAAKQQGITHTPTFFISSPYWGGEWELENFLTVRPYQNKEFENRWLEHLLLLVSNSRNLWIPALLSKVS